jgi:hypothetical protein
MMGTVDFSGFLDCFGLSHGFQREFQGVQETGYYQTADMLARMFRVDAFFAPNSL